MNLLYKQQAKQKKKDAKAIYNWKNENLLMKYKKTANLVDVVSTSCIVTHFRYEHNVRDLREVTV